MVDRRSFFKSLALLAGAASLSPQIFIPKFEPVRWKRSRGWFVAEFEYAILPCPIAFEQIVFHVREKRAEVIPFPGLPKPFPKIENASGDGWHFSWAEPD